MRLLISAYACAPDRGSEHGIGWSYITEAHRQGHDIWAMASPAHRRSILAAADPALAGLTWIFPDIPVWKLRAGEDAVWERSHNLLWQIAARRIARRLMREIDFDLIHHLTWGGLRAPTFLGGLGIPLIIGPLGGGETSPPALRKTLRPKARLTEALRDASNATIMLNPVVRGGLRDSAVIFTKTLETAAILPAALRQKCLLFPELTISPDRIGAPRSNRPVTPRLLFVGRLLYWKAAHIAVEAFAGLRTQMPNARLTLIGKGPEHARLQAQIAARGLSSAVEMIPFLPRSRLTEIYDSHDMLLFPSLHDSSGNVVLEALGRGLPVTCLDLGGPRQIVTPACGLIVSTEGLGEAALAANLARAMRDVLENAARLAALSAGAIDRARQFNTSARIGEFYSLAREAAASPLTHPRPRERKSPLFLRRKTQKDLPVPASR